MDNLFNITLSDGKEIEIIAVHLDRNCVDFKWVGGEYEGVCLFHCTITDLNAIPAQIEEAANAILVFTVEAEKVVEEVVEGAEDE